MKKPRLNNTAETVFKIMKFKGLEPKSLSTLLKVSKACVYHNTHCKKPTSKYVMRLISKWPEEELKILGAAQKDGTSIDKSVNAFGRAVTQLQFRDNIPTIQLALRLGITKAYISYNHTKRLGLTYVKRIMEFWEYDQQMLWQAAIQSQMRLNVILTPENVVLLRELFGNEG